MSFGILPDSDVIGIAQTYFPYMNAFGKDIGQQEREAWERFWSNSSFMFWQRSKFALAVGSKRQTGLDIFWREIREVGQNLLFAHAAGEVFQHIRYSHSHSANGRFAATLARFDCDDLAIIHAGMITKPLHLARQRKQLGKDTGLSRKRLN